MKLTAATLKDAVLVVNPDHKLVLQLRSLQLVYIENLELTNDVFQVMDFTNNDLVELSGIPASFKNLEVILLANNNIVTVKEPLTNESVKTISLINNNITQLKEVVNLRHLHLEVLFLMGNPIAKHHFYRLFIIWLIPSLRVLDGEKVSAKERAQGQEQFGPDFDGASPSAVALLEGQQNVSEKEGVTKEERLVKNAVERLSEEEKTQLLKELEEAETEEEVERISEILRRG